MTSQNKRTIKIEGFSKRKVLRKLPEPKRKKVTKRGANCIKRILTIYRHILPRTSETRNIYRRGT
jgi:hypothetical protein